MEKALSHGQGYTIAWLEDNADGDKGATLAHGEEGFATCLYQECLEALTSLSKSRSFKTSSKISPDNAVARLYLWGASLGNGKLDTALQQSDDFRLSVLELLVSIGSLLIRAGTSCKTAIATEDRNQAAAARRGLPEGIGVPASSSSSREISISTKTPLDSLSFLVDQAKSLMVVHDSETMGPCSEEYEDETSDEDDPINISESCILDQIDFSIQCLMELGPTLRRNLLDFETTSSDRSRQASALFSVSTPAMSYVSALREKFPNASSHLVERLGEANWQRHLRIRGRIFPDAVADEAQPSSLFKPSSMFHDSGIGTTVPPQSRYSPSHASYCSSNLDTDTGSLRAPPTPAEVATGKPFPCHICWTMLSGIKDRIGWK